MKNWIFFIFFISSLIIACTPATETVEMASETGGKMVFQRRKSDGAKQGIYKLFSSDGHLLEQATYENDSLHGIQQYFYPNQQVEHEYHFDKGVLNGPYTRYFEDGKVSVKQTYKDGALEGKSTRYYPNGAVMEEVELVKNEENGPFKEYYDNGNIKAEGNYIYADDSALEQGELREYDSTGVLIRIAECEQGICRTKWKIEGEEAAK